MRRRGLKPRKRTKEGSSCGCALFFSSLAEGERREEEKSKENREKERQRERERNERET